MLVHSPTNLPYHVDSLTRSEGWRMPLLHRHESYEIYIVDSGQTNILYDGGMYSVSKGCVMLFSPNLLHRNCGNGAFSRRTVYFTRKHLCQYFTDAAVDRLLKCFENCFIDLPPGQYNKLSAAVDTLLKMYDTPQQENSFMVLAQMFYILNSASSPNSSSCINNVVGKALSYINKNFSSINNIDEVAAASFVSKEHLCSIFKKTVGMTLTEYINNMRISHGCDLLLTTNSSITDISFECGYNSSTYFGRMFKKIVGMTPLEFKKEHEQ